MKHVPSFKLQTSRQRDFRVIRRDLASTPQARVEHFHQHFAAQLVGAVVPEHSEIRIHTCCEALAFLWRECAAILCEDGVPPIDRSKETVFRSAVNIRAMRLDNRSQEPHSLRIMLEIDLVRVQFERERRHELVSDRRNEGSQVFPVLMDDHEVIDVTAVEPASQFLFHEMIKVVEVHVAEELGRQVADGEPLALRGVKQALCSREVSPVMSAPPDDAILCWITEDDEAQKAHDKFLVETHFVPEAAESTLDFAVQESAVYRHEVASDVQLQDVAVARVVLRT